VHGLQNFASAQGRRLLCVLFLWHGRLPTHPRAARLLWLVTAGWLSDFGVPPKAALLLARLSPGPHSSIAMLFTKKLRARVKSGEVTASVRIWKTPHVKVGAEYRLEEGHIEVTSIREITWEDLDSNIAPDPSVRPAPGGKHHDGKNRGFFSIPCQPKDPSCVYSLWNEPMCH
jgi:hypothetical protein